jgi:hypothetical protein
MVIVAQLERLGAPEVHRTVCNQMVDSEGMLMVSGRAVTRLPNANLKLSRPLPYHSVAMVLLLSLPLLP